MRVYVLVQHYDRGSDEINVEGVFSAEELALKRVLEEFPGWEWVGEEETHRPGFYADPDDVESSDYVFVVEREVK